MLLQIAHFEISSRLRQPITYLYFVIILVCSLGAVDLVFEGRLGLVKTNAPYVVATTMAIYSAFFLLIISLISGVAILRDYRLGMVSLLFTKPMKKRDYLMGRFLGSFLVVVLVFTGLPAGMLLGESMPWRAASELMTFEIGVYLRPFFFLVVPTLFLGAAIFFITGALSKKLLVVYTQGILFFIVYLIAMIASRDAINPFWGSLLDPFSFETINNLVKFQAPEERNSFSLPLTGILLTNRVFWASVGLAALGVGYRGFSYRVTSGAKTIKRCITTTERGPSPPLVRGNASLLAPVMTGQGLRSQFIHTAWFYCQSVLREVSFWAIVICAGSIIFINGISLGTIHGVKSYPTTYLVLEELQELAIIFFLLIMVFFTGELIWKERGLKVDLFLDAYPASVALKLSGKYLGLLLIYTLLIVVLMGSGMAFQIAADYSNLNPLLYLTGFFGGTLKMVALFTAASFFLHALTNRKAAGLLSTLLFATVSLLPYPIGFHHPLLRFGSGDLGTYSEMNGFSHFAESFGCLTLYWSAVAVLLLLGSMLLLAKGQPHSWRQRLTVARNRMNRSLTICFVAAVSVVLLSGGYFYYQTNVRYVYYAPSEKQRLRASYEETLKQYEKLPQPEIVAVELQTDLYPSRRSYSVAGYYWLKNTTENPIGAIHVQTYPDDRITLEQLVLDAENQPDTAHQRFGHCIYVLAQKMLPGDSLKLAFRQTYAAHRYASEAETNIVENGTFFANDQLPSLGYNPLIELEDAGARANHQLPPKPAKAKQTNELALRKNTTGADAHLIRFAMIVSTEADQIGIAPGDLIRQWEQENRRYFHYRTPVPILNFYAVVSARYEVSREQWSSPAGDLVDLEVYYHPGHEYNVASMQRALKSSLDYYTEAFSPYTYRQVRIMEFPRYRPFAQSFPGNIPTSEGSGFLLDQDEATEVDMVAFVVAHELAHQWWGMQVQAANVEGRHLILESLAQYSALMVLRRLHGEEQVRNFLEREHRLYLQARAATRVREQPLARVRDQEYIYYKKGAINLYALQAYITEDSLNLALRRFVRDWALPAGKSATSRYATSADLLDYFRAVTPDSLQYLISDLFESVTLSDHAISDGKLVVVARDSFEVSLQLTAKNYWIDDDGHSLPATVKDWVEVGIYARSKTGSDSLIYRQKHLLTEQETFLKITVGPNPIRAIIDPDYLLIDRNRDNNEWLLEAIGD